MVEAEGIPPTASVASVGPGIRYAGDYVYAYSGTFQSSTTAQTVIETTTGSGIIVGEFQLNGPVQAAEPNVGTICTGDIKFNGETIAIIKTDTASESQPGSESQKVIIPPFTTISVSVDSDNNQAARLGTVTFTGRVYDV